MLALLIIGICCYITNVVVGVTTVIDDGRPGRVISFIFTLFAGLILIELGLFRLVDREYENGQIDALKGTQTYQIHYIYPKGDTIPSDTLYLKIK